MRHPKMILKYAHVHTDRPAHPFLDLRLPFMQSPSCFIHSSCRQGDLMPVEGLPQSMPGVLCGMEQVKSSLGWWGERIRVHGSVGREWGVVIHGHDSSLRVCRTVHLW